MAWRNTLSGLQLDDENLVAFWLNEARKRGANAQWTRRAERDVMYAKGDFSGLLGQVDQSLETLPGHIIFQYLRAIALMNLGNVDAARDTLRQALESGGYISGQPLIGSELSIAVQLANVLDMDGNADERDALLAGITDLLAQRLPAEPANSDLLYISASVASVRDDLPGVLRELKAAVDAGFRHHWELLRDPVFKRWQDNPDFIAFHQGMLEAAARMRAEYYVNNPAELTAVAPEGTH
jgi:hypothetical protein